MLTIKCKRPNLFIMPCLKCFYLPWCNVGQTAIELWTKAKSVTHGNFERDEFIGIFTMKTFRADKPTKKEIERKFEEK